MSFVYLIITLTWLGVLTVYLKQFIRRWDGQEDFLLCFLVSAALLPQILGVLSLLSFMILAKPGIAHYYLCLGLAVIALFVFYRKGELTFPRYSLVDIDWRSWSVPILAALLVLPVLLEKLYLNSSVPLWGHDALIYANEARILAEGGSLADIPWFGGRLDGSVTVNHAHGPLFTVFLAQALLSGDQIVRLAFQCTTVSVLFSVVALGRATGWFWAGTASVLGYLVVQPVGYASFISSRDAFRIAPLVIFIIIIISLVRTNGRGCREIRYALPVVALVTCMAHALNLIFVPVVFAAGLLIVWIQRKDWRCLIKFFLPTGVILIIIALPYLINIVVYGNPLGLGVYYPIYKGTAIWDGFIAAGNWGKSMGFIDVLIKIQDVYGPIQTWGLLVGLSLCMVLGWENRRSDYLFWLGLVGILISTVPAFIAIDSEGVNLSGAFSSNLRYPMAGYAFLGLAIYSPISISLRRLNLFINHPKILKLGFAILFVGSAYLARDEIKKWSCGDDFPVFVKSEEWRVGAWQLIELAKDMPLKDGAWYTDNYSPAYYATGINRPKFLFTRESRPLLTAKTVPDVIKQIHDNRIGMISLSKNYRSAGWQQTMIYKVLSSCDDVEHKDLYRWEVFILKPKFGSESCRDKISNAD